MIIRKNYYAVACYDLKTPLLKTSPKLPDIHIYLNYPTLIFT